MENKTELLSKLLRELEVEIGTSDLANLVLMALVDAITAFKTKKGVEDFCTQFIELVKTTSSTEPKFGILNRKLGSLLKHFQESICCTTCEEEEWKKAAISNVNEILFQAKAEKACLIKFSEELNVENKTILIHDHSHTVQNALKNYKSIGRKFKVIIAEQDFDKTHSNIESMHSAEIPFQVVPAYMLSHIHKEIDMLFFGALTLKDTMDFVMDPGTLSLISEFHEEGVPVYMFINTSKFSLWKSKKRGEVFMHKHVRKHATKPFEYERVKYSHDRVPAKLFHRIVTNKGVFTPAEIEKIFKDKMEHYGKGEEVE